LGVAGGALDAQVDAQAATRDAPSHGLADTRLQAFEAGRQPQPHVEAASVHRAQLPMPAEETARPVHPRKTGHALDGHEYLRRSLRDDAATPALPEPSLYSERHSKQIWRVAPTRRAQRHFQGIQGIEWPRATDLPWAFAAWAGRKNRGRRICVAL